MKYICQNPKCKKIFHRSPGLIKGEKYYCSTKCSLIDNHINKKFSKKNETHLITDIKHLKNTIEKLNLKKRQVKEYRSLFIEQTKNHPFNFKKLEEKIIEIYYNKKKEGGK